MRKSILALTVIILNTLIFSCSSDMAETEQLYHHMQATEGDDGNPPPPPPPPPPPNK